MPTIDPNDPLNPPPGGEELDELKSRVTEGMESVADYVRDRDMETMLDDLGRLVKRHPGATLAAAAAIGFVLARSLSRQ